MSLERLSSSGKDEARDLFLARVWAALARIIAGDRP
jgi:hypothetical protein